MSLEQLAFDLIKIQSTPKFIQNKKEIIEFVQKYFEKYSTLQFHYYNFFTSPCLLVAKELYIDYDIIFCMHLDVVEGKPEQFDPFISNGKIYGRGAADMKGASATIMKAFEELINSPATNKIALLFTTDEETAGNEGKNAILDPKLHGKCVVICDIKSHDIDQLVNECKGILFTKLNTRSNKGKSAITLLIEDLIRVRKLFNNEHSGWNATINIGRIEGGKTAETVAEVAEAILDIRTTEKETPEILMPKIKQAILYSHIEILQKFPAVYVDPTNIFFSEMKKIMETHLKKNVAVFKEEGSSDARFFALKQIPSILCSPLSFDMHLETDSIDVASMYTYKEIFKNFMASSVFEH